ncbi:Mlc titration factor A [Raoultella terrigena]|uniref:Mlc titration factor A n=1 Tax=Raoultella terrigena TaxID=577 RepID=A0A4U9D396_RAOTE|nr:Mlc titration factor A [Raoultella terrigena]
MFKWPWKANEESGSVEIPWEQALAIPVLANLSAQEQQQLVQMSARFLQQKRLVALQGLELTPLQSARIAMLFCLPVLELGIEWLDGFHEVLIYPAPFVVDDEWEDDIGLVHNQRVVQSGQSWQQGPIILNWLDIQDSFDASGFNLVVHEVAHKLDTRNGDRASGVPLIPLREVAGWEHDLHAAMNNIQDEIDLVGESAASIDATPRPTRRNVLPFCQNISLAHPSCSPRVFRRFGSVFASFTARTRCRDYVIMNARMRTTRALCTKTTS